MSFLSGLLWNSSGQLQTWQKGDSPEVFSGAEKIAYWTKNILQ